MKTVAVYLTERQVRYINSLAVHWKASKSWVVREIVEFHAQNFTSSGGNIPSSTTTHTDGETAEGAE